MKQQEYYMWKNEQVQLEKSVQACLSELNKKTICTKPPENFDMKKQIIRQKLQREDIPCEDQQYLDVFAFMIEQRTNVSLLDLAQQFYSNFGKNIDYWTVRITSWATLKSFSNRFTVWSVNQQQRNFVNYKTSPLQQSSIRTWRSRAQTYFSCLISLIGKIKKLKKTDNPYILDETFKNYHCQKNLYKTFILTSSNDIEDDINGEVTITHQNRSKAAKKLFNFPSVGNNDFGFDLKSKKATNTLQNYNFFIKSDKENINSMEQQSKIKRKKAQYQQFKKNLQSIGKTQPIGIETLREYLFCYKQLYHQQIENQNKKFVSQPSIELKQFDFNSQQTRLFPLHHFTNIHDKRRYFQYEAFPVSERQQIRLTQPLNRYSWISYQIDDFYEYQELIAESLTDNSQNQSNSLEDDEYQGQSDFWENFIDKRYFIPADGQEVNQLDQIIAKMRYNQRRQPPWLARRSDSEILDNFMIIPVYGECPFTMEGTDDPRITKNKLNKKQEKNIPVQINKIQNLSQNQINKDQNFGQNFQEKETVYNFSNFQQTTFIEADEIKQKGVNKTFEVQNINNRQQTNSEDQMDSRQIIGHIEKIQQFDIDRKIQDSSIKISQRQTLMNNGVISCAQLCPISINDLPVKIQCQNYGSNSKKKRKYQLKQRYINMNF